MITPEPDFKNVALSTYEPIEWLWPGRIPIGKLSLFIGDPGVGKSTLVTDIAARTTTEVPWPDAADSSPLPDPPSASFSRPTFNDTDSVNPAHAQTNSSHPSPLNPSPNTAEFASSSLPAPPSSVSKIPIRPAQVAFLTAEEETATTLRPRLEAAGANIYKIIALAGCLDIDEVIDRLDELLNHLDFCKLIAIDPLAAFFRGAETGRGQNARRILKELTDVASNHQAAMIAIAHRSRTRHNAPIMRVSSSLAITAAARTIWLIDEDPCDPNRRLFVPLKNNLAPTNDGLAFTIQPAEDAPDTARIHWDPTPIKNPLDALKSPRHESTADANDVDEWLLTRLAGGPVASGDIKLAGLRDGFSWRSIQRAKQRLDIRAKLMPDLSSFMDTWHWFTPQTEKTFAETVPKSTPSP